MSFDWHRLSKVEDWFYEQAIDSIRERIEEVYGKEVAELTEEEFTEIESFMENEVYEYSPILSGWSGIRSEWEDRELLYE